MNINQSNVLSEMDQRQIYESIVNIFGEVGSKKLQFDILAFKNTVDAVIQEMELETYSFTSYWSNEPITVTRKKIGAEVARKNYLAMKGFLLIFKFREFLFSEAINYRYYFQDKEGRVQ